jgi:hypothetical protein
MDLGWKDRRRQPDLIDPGETMDPKKTETRTETAAAEGAWKNMTRTA